MRDYRTILTRLRESNYGAVIAIVGVVVLLALVLPSPFYFRMAAIVFIYGLAVLGLNLLMGFAGQVSLGHAGFFGIGAYAVAVGPTHLGIPSWIAVMAGAAAAGLIAFAVGRPVLRLKGHYLAVATLGMGLLIAMVFTNEANWSGGPDGMPVPRLDLFGWVVRGSVTWYWVSGLSLAVAALIAANLINSPTGRAFRAIHDSEVASAVLGVDVARYKLIAFVLSAIYAAVAGAYLALFDGLVTPVTAGFIRSIEFVTMAVLGGLGSIFGSIVGAAVLVLLPQVLTVFHDYQHIALGLIIIVFMVFLRAGIVPTLAKLIGAEGVVNVLAAEGLGLDFGGVKAVDGVSFSVRRAEIFAIIGPNGAGKTSLFNVVSGIYKPNRGHVLLDGKDVTTLPPHQLARRGLSRTFQNLQVFYRMSAVENVMVGRHLHERRSVLAHMLMLPAVERQNRQTRDKAAELLALVGLAQAAARPAGTLPYGALKRLEIARALATEPKVLLLDEPAAGCNAVETEEIDAVIQKIAAGGITVVLVEHDMRLVMKISDRIHVLNQGRTLAEGTASEVRANPEVIAAYLGAHAEAASARH